MCFKSIWIIRKNCLVVEFRGVTRVKDIYDSISIDNVSRIMLNEAINFIERGEKFEGIIMAEEPYIPFNKGEITIYFKMIFPSMGKISQYMENQGQEKK